MSRKLLFALFALFLLSVPLIVQAQDTVTVRAVWTQDILVLINISNDPADLSDLTLTSARGEIAPDDWVMGVDPETTLSYSLRSVLPGGCLIVYFAGNARPDIPASVECRAVVGEFTPTTFGDLVWDITQGGFTSSTGVTCDVTSGSSCEFVVPLGSEDVTDEMVVPETVPSRVIWNADILVVINISEYGADWSDLGLTSASGGAIEPGQWVLFVDEKTTLSYDLHNVRPGSCLISYLGGTEQPELPENVECTRIIGEFTPENLEDLVWDVNAGGFTATGGEQCDVEMSTTCDLTVPVAPVELGMEPEPDAEETGGANVRAIWNEDIFVLINISDAGADLSRLNLTAANGGAINATDWALGADDSGRTYTLEDVRPGSCLISYRADTEQPDLPENVECTRIIGEFTPVNLDDVIWNVNSGGFTVSTGGAACAVVGSTDCDITVPVSE